MHLQPERTGDGCRIDAGLSPPCRFIAKAVYLAMIPWQSGTVNSSLTLRPSRRVLDEA
jgi:hypothetical protein